MFLLERLINHIKGHEGVWFASLADIARRWQDDDEDRRRMALPDVRGVEPMPERYHWPQ